MAEKDNRSEAPFYWPDAQGFAIGAIITICALALFLRMFRTSNVDDKMLDTMITIMFSTCLVSVFQYLFGSSRGSSNKDETQNKIVEKALATTPTPPATPTPVTAGAVGEATLSNGELTYFRSLTSEEAKKAFLNMTSDERKAIIAKVGT